MKFINKIFSNVTSKAICCSYYYYFLLINCFFFKIFIINLIEYLSIEQE